MRGILLLIAALLFAAPAAADDTPRPAGTLSDAQIDQLYQSFGLIVDQAPLTGPGADVVRVLVRDGIGRPVLVLEGRKLDQDGARVWLRTIRRQAREPSTQELLFGSRAGWQPFASLADEVAAGPPESPRNTDELCVNPWTVFVDSRIGQTRSVRSIDTCNNYPMVARAYEPLMVVVKLLPGCLAVKEADRYGDLPFVVSACLTMAGRNPAGESAVLNRLAGPEFARGGSPDDRPEPVFAADAAVDWAGTKARGAPEAEALLKARLLDAPLARMWVDQVSGDSRGVTVIGGTAYSEDSGATFEARFTQTWVRDPAGAWRVKDWKVGRYKPVPRPL